LLQQLAAAMNLHETLWEENGPGIALFGLRHFMNGIRYGISSAAIGLFNPQRSACV
jgi:hypothetical protein